MATADETWTQLATRVPKDLHLYYVTRDLVLMHFMGAAIEEKLGRKRGSKKKPA